jgi:xanthine phosphoribosyltransferase
MEILKKKIIQDGVILNGNILKVDNFLNHQIDVILINEIGKEFKRLFSDKQIDKILTIEASGIAIAVIAAQYFDNIPVVFAKKYPLPKSPEKESKEIDAPNKDSLFFESTVFSYTKKEEYLIRVSKQYLKKNENVLIIDDFLAQGMASKSLISLVEKSGANLVGVGIVIEKGFQEGGKFLREQGVNLKSLVIIEKFEDGKVIFREEGDH